MLGAKRMLKSKKLKLRFNPYLKKLVIQFSIEL